MLYILSRYRQNIIHTFIENINKLNASTKYENNITANAHYKICQLLKQKNIS